MFLCNVYSTHLVDDHHEHFMMNIEVSKETFIPCVKSAALGQS